MTWKGLLVGAAVLALAALEVAAERPIFVGADRYFRIDAEGGTDRRGRPIVAGYVYNNYGLAADRMRLRIQRLDASRTVRGETDAYVGSIVPPNNRTYFEVRVPEAAAAYRVEVLSFDWVGRGGGG